MSRESLRGLCGERHPQAHVLTCNADGSEFKDLGNGAVPSWSPDGRQITFTSAGPERGICLMNADGSNRRAIGVRCWGSHFSPTRNEIACSAYDDNGANLIIYDVAKEECRSLLDKSYQRIYWGVAWSPDGDWICFKGLLPDGGAEIAAVSVQGEKKGFKVLLPATALPEVANSNSTMSWGGSANQILVAMQKSDDTVKRLYSLDSQGEKPPQLFSGYPADWGNVDTAWSPDLKMVILAAKPTLRNQ